MHPLSVGNWVSLLMVCKCIWYHCMHGVLMMSLSWQNVKKFTIAWFYNCAILFALMSVHSTYI